jgi:hypothetical protein
LKCTAFSAQDCSNQSTRHVCSSNWPVGDFDSSFNSRFLVYKATRLKVVYRVDLIVEDLVIVEIKCVDVICSVHKAQVLTYLRLTETPAGLLINFNVARLIDGVNRLINPTSSVPRQQMEGEGGTD